MLKQSVSRIKKVLPVLLAVLFVMSLTAASASAYRGNHHHGYGGFYGYPYDYYPSVAPVSVGFASPVEISSAVVPAVTTSIVAASPLVVASPVEISSVVVPAVTTSIVAASPLVVASEPGILATPLATGFEYDTGLDLYPGLGYGGLYGGWGYGGHNGGHHHR
jgi:hypothetical protein